MPTPQTQPAPVAAVPVPVPAPAPREPSLRTLAVGALPADMLAAVLQESELRKQEVAATALVVGQKEWGKNLSDTSIRALITWGKAWDVDVATEVDILGGNIYRNANYYLRKLAEMVDLELVDYAVADYVHVDERLTAQNTQAATLEIGRRLDERIKYGLRDESVAVCIFRIKLHALSEEMVGFAECGWKGTGRKPGKPDPVGEAEPVKTAATRATRRAMRQIVTHIPAFDAKEKALDEASKSIGVQLGQEIHDTKEEIKQRNEKVPVPSSIDPSTGQPFGSLRRTPPPVVAPVAASAVVPPSPPPPEDGDPGVV